MHRGRDCKGLDNGGGLFPFLALFDFVRLLSNVVLVNMCYRMPSSV